MVKFQVWSPAQQRWRTAYVRNMVQAIHNSNLFRAYGFKTRYHAI